MSINLTASQKNIRNLFYNTTQYVIPEFQRPYSWGYEECYQLYTDLADAFVKDEDYFLGNIILACSDENKESPLVIDGQQRLITLWVLLKVLSVYVEDIDLANTVLKIKSWKKAVSDKPKIISNVSGQKDGEYIEKLLDKSRDYLEKALKEAIDSKGRIRESKCPNHVEYCALLFYKFLSQDDITTEQKEKFTDFLLDKISMLPIQMEGQTIKEACDKALSIFETINNRGLNLQDADIFKARLYNNAVAKGQEEDFNRKWATLTEQADAIGSNIDEIFRFYYHIIRGQKGIITAEGKLRDFFLNDKDSPLKNMSDYSVLMENLFHITNILNHLYAYNYATTEISSWIQVLKAYSNNYPMYAIVAYMYKNEELKDNDFLRYIKSIARCVYYAGSTTSVKFPIYTIIQRMSENLSLEEYYQKDFKFSDLNISSRLLLGYSLIAYYHAGSDYIKDATIDKFIYNSEISKATEFSKPSDIDASQVNTLGNCIVVEKSLRNLSISDRLNRMLKLNKKGTFLDNFVLNKNGIKTREEKIEEHIKQFFTDNETV